MKLEDLNVFPHFRGFRHEQLFENGWGVSIIPEADGIHYELAVLAHEQRKKKQLSYTSTITNDVIRMCTVDAIDTLTDRIKNLPQRSVPIPQSVGLPGPDYD
jgi:hypothetical protein